MRRNRVDSARAAVEGTKTVPCYAERSGRPEDSNAIDAGHHADVDRLSGRRCISTGGLTETPHALRIGDASCAISMA